MQLMEIRTAKITEKGQIAIPKKMRKTKGFKEGEKIAVLAFKDHIELRSFNQISKKLAIAIASEKSLAKNWLSKEDEKACKHL